MRSCSQCPDWGLALSIAPSSSLDTSQRPQAPFPQNGNPLRASKVAPGALWNGIKYRAVLGNRRCSSPSTHLVGSLCGACSPHLWTWPPPAQAPPITTRGLSTQRLLGEPLPQRWLTLEMERGTLKSLPPCSRKPQGAGPSSTTLKDSMVPALGRKKKVSGQHGGCAGRLSSGH